MYWRVQNVHSENSYANYTYTIQQSCYGSVWCIRQDPPPHGHRAVVAGPLRRCTPPLHSTSSQAGGQIQKCMKTSRTEKTHNNCACFKIREAVKKSIFLANMYPKKIFLRPL